MTDPEKTSFGGGSKTLGRRTVLRWVCAGGSCVVLGPAPWGATGQIEPDASCALIIIDVQNCFVSGGTLAVAHGEEVVPVINRLVPSFQNVIMTQDWHSVGHTSFASSHPGAKPFQTIRLGYGDQVLWPDHCLQGTQDAALVPDLHAPQTQLILRKGFHRDIDSYSAFKEADRQTSTGLEGYLKQRGIKRLFLAGLATDFCVAWTALDARAANFDCYVIEDACRGIDLNGSLAKAWKGMESIGVKRIQSTQIAVS
jgi:nicotinamidase/pyrazinamidase